MVFSDSISSLEEGEAKVYLKKQAFSREIFPDVSHYHYICDIFDKTLNYSGIPQENISETDLAVLAPNCQFDPDAPIIFYSIPDDNELFTISELIKSFNRTNEAIVIYTSPKILFKIKAYANSNILLKVRKEKFDSPIKTRLILGYGYIFRKFILAKIPVMVIGPYGFGGVVLPENIAPFVESNFSGRIGGHEKEPIPFEVLIDEIIFFKNELSNRGSLNVNAKLLQQMLEKINYVPFKELKQQITSNYKNFKRIKITEKARIRLVSNIFLIQRDGAVIIQRQYLNDFLFSVPKTDYVIISALQEGIECKDFMKLCEMRKEEFWEMIQELWARKAISFDFSLH